MLITSTLNITIKPLVQLFTRKLNYTFMHAPILINQEEMRCHFYLTLL